VTKFSVATLNILTRPFAQPTKMYLSPAVIALAQSVYSADKSQQTDFNINPHTISMTILGEPRLAGGLLDILLPRKITLSPHAFYIQQVTLAELTLVCAISSTPVLQ